MPVAGGVDLEREERLKKGELCVQQFRSVWQSPALRHIADKKNEMGNFSRRLLTDLEFFLKSCDRTSGIVP